MTTKVDRIINQMTQRSVTTSDVAGNLILPNHSGDHSAGKVLATPKADTDIANKKYVDDSISSAISNVIIEGTIAGENLTLVSQTHDDVPIATPLYLKTKNNQALKIHVPNVYNQTIWELAPNTWIIGDGMVIANADGDAYWAIEFVDGYSYLAYGPNGYEIYTNNEETLVCDMYPDGTTEWYQNAIFNGNVSCATCTVGNGATGSFTTADGKTVTVTNGIITSIV